VWYFGLLVYCDLVRPEATGMQATFAASQMTVAFVAEDSPAARAGLQPGDVIEAANGIQVRTTTDWTLVDATLEIDQPGPVIVRRHGDEARVEFQLARAPVAYWITGPGVALVAVLAVQGVTLLLALIVAVRRRSDPLALLGAWVLGTMAVYTIVLPYRF